MLTHGNVVANYSAVIKITQVCVYMQTRMLALSTSMSAARDRWLALWLAVSYSHEETLSCGLFSLLTISRLTPLPNTIYPSLFPPCLFLFPLLQSSLQTSHEDVLLSYLPVAHMFERVVEVHAHNNVIPPLPLCVSCYVFCGVSCCVLCVFVQIGRASCGARV